jgi:hypothetical protein
VSALGIWALIKGLPWKVIGIAFAVAGLVVLLWRAPWAENRGFHKRDAEVGALSKTISDMKMASAQAQADAEASARRIEASQTRATQEATRDLQTQLAAARAAASAYAARLRVSAGAVTGGASKADSAGATQSAGATAGGGALPLMDDDDLLICSENTVKAQGWLAWWRKISAIPR